jgi:FeS assembly protein IscX
MISPVELHRILAEWRVRLQRAKDILQPPTWNEKEWRQFSQALALMVRDHGRSWIIDPNVYWDLRWNLQDGGELVCQIEHVPGEKTSLVVAQNGGFAESVGSYTWLWAEFNMEGNFSRDPYWVEGTWKDALTAFLLPLDRQSAYLLAGRAETPDSLLLQDGARPNDRNGLALLPGMNDRERATNGTQRDEKIIWVSAENYASSSRQKREEKPARAIDEPVSAEPSKAPNEKSPEVVTEPPPSSFQKPQKEKNGEAGGPRIDTPAPFAIRWGMPSKLTWKDTDEIAYALIDAFPDQDPLKLSFPKLHKMVIDLEDFGDEPEKSSESILESIQMAWYEEVK